MYTVFKHRSVCPCEAVLLVRGPGITLNQPRMLIFILSRSPDIAVLDWSDSLLMPRAPALSSLAHHTYLCPSSTSNTLTVK